MKTKAMLCVVASALVLMVTSCATYYKVIDPGSGRAYYTQEIERERGGAATFTDAGSGSEVTIQNSEVKEISEEEFDVGRFAADTKPTAAPAAPAAPAPAPSAAPAPEESSAPAEESK